ncbi:MAG: hypothetical protein V1776_02170 [Candidatus Diapherotrites archaeon]
MHLIEFTLIFGLLLSIGIALIYVIHSHEEELKSLQEKWKREKETQDCHAMKENANAFYVRTHNKGCGLYKWIEGDSVHYE